MTKHHLTTTAFSTLDLHPHLIQGIKEAGFIHCTPVQEQVLPVLLADGDVAAQAQTGTGKTATFLLAVMDHLLRASPAQDRRPNQPRALILAPTRELAIQIKKDADMLGQHTGLQCVLAYGGTGYEEQRQQIARGTDILIGTPGRLIDYLKQRVYDLKAIQVFVLDEADRMFDLGFIKDVRYLLRRAPRPEKRLSMLFSATLGYRITELAYEHMNNPTLVIVEPDKVTVDRVRELAYFPSNAEKIPLLLGLLGNLTPTRALVFVNTKRTGDRLGSYLQENRWHAGVLSGDVPQRKRQRLLHDFLNGKLPILVATDVAARGLHVPGISHVFNFDLPQDPEDYVHRIGRTARAGSSGEAISFICEDYAFSVPLIEEYIGHKIPTAPITEELLAQPIEPGKDSRHRTRSQARTGKRRYRERSSGRRGRRKSSSPNNTKPTL